MATSEPAVSRTWTIATWVCGWLAALLLMLWTRTLHAAYLFGAGAAMLAAAMLYVHCRKAMPGQVARPLRAGFVVLLVALVVSAGAHSRFEIIEYRWQSVSSERQREVAATLSSMMSDIEERAHRAAEEAAGIGAPVGVAERVDSVLLQRLDSIRAHTRVDGLVMLSDADAGEMIAWAGEHRGRLPDTLRTHAPPVYFAERALFSYLYYSVPVPGAQRHAVAAVLIDNGLTGDVAHRGFAASFRDQVNADVSFHAGHPGMGGKAIWNLVSNGDTIVHARLVAKTQADQRQAAEVMPRLVVMLLVLLGFGLLGAGWVRLMQWHAVKRGAGVPLLGAIPLFAIAPIGNAFGLQGIFSPILFVLEGPLTSDVTLGSLIAVLLPATAFIASMRRPSLPPRLQPWAVPVAAIIAGVAFPVTISLLLAAATPGLLAGGPALWFGFHVLGVLVLTVIAAMLLPGARTSQDAEAKYKPGSTALLITGVVLSIALGVYIASAINPDVPVISTLAALWALPFALFAFGLDRYGGRSGALARWAAAGCLAVTAVLPHVWDAHILARLDAAEQELATLGTNEDPYLDYRLDAFGQQAAVLFDAGEDSVPLLYSTWVASGLARQPYATEIMLWSPATVQTVQLGSPAELHTPAEDTLIRALVDSARSKGVQELFAFRNLPHISRALMIPLGNGEVISVIVPPRRSLDRRFGVAFFLGGVLPVTTRLRLEKATDPSADPHRVTWRRSQSGHCGGQPCAEGWRSETLVQYPDAKYHAHLLVSVPPMRVLIARAVLLVALDYFILLALWVAGAAARGRSPIPLRGWKSWIGSFRARITLALFAFFLIPTATFGYVAYRALAQEVERATQLVAERAAQQAAAEFPGKTASLHEMSSHTGTDVLRYNGGELIDVSSPEALELGVYGAWMPAHIYRILEAAEESGAVGVEQLGSQRLLTAYHALVASGTLAVPMPLISSDTAERQGELAHVILFAALIGALLSIGLSLVVGRALAGPIGRLTRASTAVGAGRLGVRLPENAPGEFGQLYETFNQMVRRLRRARSREIRTARVLAWGEMARQVAHEIKNPLTPIKLAVQHIRRAYNDRRPDFPEILESNVSQVLIEIDHLSEISRAFSRYGAPAQAAGPLQPVEIAQIVREALTLYHGDGRLHYVEDVSSDVPAVLARPGELKEVLFNLIDNARNAIEENGTITVHARLSDGQVYVEVEDTGTGISDDMLPRIFEPHFSTSTSGTGLGLAIVRRLVESWGGTVEAESERGRGTKVCVRMLPADLLTG